MNLATIDVFQRYLGFRAAVEEFCAGFEVAYDCALRQHPEGFMRMEDLPSERRQLTAQAMEILNSKWLRTKETFEHLSELVPGQEVAHYDKVRVELMHWAQYRMDEREYYNAFRTVEELVRVHLPAMEAGLFAWLRSSKNLHPKLLQATGPLLKTSQWDSAVRKAFIVVSEGLRERTGIAGEDGTGLISKAFGGSSALLDPMGYDPKALVQFFDGFYKLFRNRHAHHDHALEQPETQAILAVANWATLLVESAKELH